MMGIRRRAIALVLLVPEAGCSAPVDSGWTEDGARAGYVSGDRSVTTWPKGERTGPVTITGTTYAGDVVDTTSWLGTPVVLNTWYAACPPCRAEAPDLVALAEDYDGRIEVLGINSTDEAGAAEPFERTFEVPYPSIQDTDGEATAALQDIVPVQAVPTTVVLDAEGRVAARVLGRVDPATLRAMVDEVLAETS